MGTPNWDNERSTLRARFTGETITKASRKELEFYLVVLANSSLSDGRMIQPEAHKTETKAFANTVTQLLQVRINEELHWRSMIAAWVAVVISVIALCLTGFQSCDSHHVTTSHKANTNAPAAH